MDAKREHSTGRSTRGKTFPLLGGAILLLSFSTQNFFHDRRNSQMKELETAMSDRTLVDKSVLLNEVLYFVASVPDSGMTSKVRDAYISEAARELVLSSTIPVSLMDSITTEQKTDILNTLNARGA